MRKSLRVVTHAGVVSLALAAAFPAPAALTDADRFGTPLILETPGGASASVGSSVSSPAALDRIAPNKTASVSEGNVPQFMNVMWGDTVLFTVRQHGLPDRIVKWRFDGLDSVMSYANVDPYAQFASNMRIYVDQSSNPMRSPE